MSSKNSVIVVCLILGSFLVVAAVAYIRQAGIVTETFDKGQRLTAAPGKTRKNAMILTSNKRPTTKDPEDAIARRGDQAEDDDPLEIKSLSKSTSDAAREGPAGAAAREALSSFSPEAGLRQLDEALALPNSPDQVALLQEAKGQLHAQTSPPDYDKSLASFDEAATAAQSPEVREGIVYKTVQMLIQAGREEEARDHLDRHLTAEPPHGPTGYKLQIIQGQLLESAGKLEEAESAYQTVLAAVQEVPDHLDKEAALSLARLAGLRLTGLYRRHDRRQAADTLAVELKRQIARMEEHL